MKNMSKGKSDFNNEFEKEEKPMKELKPKLDPVVLTDTAFGTYKDPDGKYVLVRIQYDGVTGTVGSISREVMSTSKEEAISRFKIAVSSESNIVG